MHVTSIHAEGYLLIVATVGFGEFLGIQNFLVNIILFLHVCARINAIAENIPMYTSGRVGVDTGQVG